MLTNEQLRIVVNGIDSQVGNIDAKESIISIIEKGIEMKPDYDSVGPRCPRCWSRVQTQDNYCVFCGQKIMKKH